MEVAQEPAPTYIVREARLTEVPLIRAMHRESWLATYPNDENGVSLDWVHARVDKWLDPDQLARSEEILGAAFSDSTQYYRIAEQDGIISGLVHGSTKPDGSKYLEGLYTLPESFGTGLGAQLFEGFNTWAEGAAVSLQVAAYNNRAIKFYEKQGFKIVPESNHLFAETIPCIVMNREQMKPKESK